MAPANTVVETTGHQQSPIVWDDIDFAFRPYDPWLAYAQSETAKVLFAVEPTRRRADDNSTANALMRGAICTNLQRHTAGRGSGRVPAELIKTVEQGAATSALLATSPLLEGVGDRYFVDCNETETETETEIVDRRSGPLHGVPATPSTRRARDACGTCRTT